MKPGAAERRAVRHRHPAPGSRIRRSRLASPGLGFVARFLAGAIAGLAALAWIPAITDAAIALTARHAAALARVAGVALHPEGDRLVLGGLHLEVVPECTPLVPFVLLASAMAAYPATLRHRLLGIAVAAPALWIYNLVRVLALVAVLAARPRWFEFVHVYLWQAVTLAACAGLFVLWLRRAETPGRPARAALPR